MPTIHTHTTLRTLFAATTVFAILAATWDLSINNHFWHFIVLPCAVGFVAGLFGFSFVAAVLIALAVAVVANALLFAVASTREMAPEWAIRMALNNFRTIALWSVVPWLTAWWWGLYLRYVWSNPTQALEPHVHEGDDPHKCAVALRRLVRVLFHALWHPSARRLPIFAPPVNPFF